ncbi:MAG: nucleotidyltransferase family protein, partial [Candidatus Omnitrophica bacterium]|nr:nucleotidyltransferase family protein [Candidatus Omnitrophota bacterium]
AVDADKNIFMMSAEHMLLAVCIHGLSHGFSRINLLFDLHSFISRYRDSLDWDRLQILSRNWGAAGAVYIGIRLARDTFGTEIPREFLEELKPQGESFLEKHFLKYVKNNDFPSEDMCVILYLALNQGFFNKAGFIFRGLALKAKKVRS